MLPRWVALKKNNNTKIKWDKKANESIFNIIIILIYVLAKEIFLKMLNLFSF
jgi:hypothetical protein